jgi:hypothetical protein
LATDWGAVLTLRVASPRPDLLLSRGCDAMGVDPEHVWHPAAQVWQTPGQGEAAVNAALESTDEEMVAGFGSLEPPADHALAMRRAWDRTTWSCALALYRSSIHVHHEWAGEVEQARAHRGLAIITNEELTEKAWPRRSAARSGAVAELTGLGHWWLL